MNREIWQQGAELFVNTRCRKLLLRNEYLVAENRILRGKIKGRLMLSDSEKTTWAEIGTG